MKKVYEICAVILCVLCSFLLQIYLFNNIKFFDVYANILLVTVIATSIWQKPITANIISAVVGIISDLLFSQYIGKYLTIYLIVSVIVQVLIKFYRKETVTSYIYITAISVVIYEIYMMTLSLILNGYFNLLHLAIIILEGVVINIALSFIVGTCIKKICIDK